MSSARDNTGTTPVRPGFAIDEGALAEWMRSHVDGFSGPITTKQFKGGQSNPTYKVITPGRTYVLRRRPPGALLRGAHAIDREYRVLRALGEAGFPVPRVFGLCTDDAVIGSWFYIMAMVEGRIFWDAALPGLEPDERAGIFDAMVTVLAQLHQLDSVERGLEDFGRPGNYFERQIARWSRQYAEDSDAGRDPHLDLLIEWLPANIPSNGDATSIIHGDLRIDNIIFHPREPKIVAVLDWELSTLGHPLADFTYNAMMYRMPPHIVAGLAGADLAALGLPTEEAYIASYCRQTGRDSLADLDFYMAFNFFRLAAIFHGIKGRVARGSAASAQAVARVRVLPELASLGWQQALRAGA